MNARTAPPNRWQPSMTRWARMSVWLLAAGVALQGSVIAATRSAEPAHFHARAMADVGQDPMLDGVRAVLNHHGASKHGHAGVARHTHDASQSGMIVLNDDPASGEPAKSSSTKRMLADLGTPTVRPALPATLPPMGKGAPPPALDYTSHVSARLERPPR